MNIIDWIIVIALCGAFAIGYFRGFIRQALRLLGFIVSFFIAYHYHQELAPVLQKNFPIVQEQSSVPLQLAHMLDIDAIFYRAAAFGILFFGTRIILFAVGAAAHALSLLPGIGTVNRWLGGTLSVLEVVLILYLAIQISLVMPWPKIHTALNSSVIYAWSDEHTQKLSDRLLDWWSGSDKEQTNKEL